MLPVEGQEGAARCGQVDARAHAVVAHILHDLRGELLAFVAAVADAQLVHQVAQPHDAEADAAGTEGRRGHLRHGGHVGVGGDDVVEEAGALLNRAAQQLPIHLRRARLVMRHVNGKID